VTNGEDVIEDLPTPVRAALVKAEQPEAAQRNLLLAASLNSSEKKIYELLNSDEAVHIDDIVERSGLNSSEVLATLFDLEMKGSCGRCLGNSLIRYCCNVRLRGSCRGACGRG
jgi:predicted Rossmann fold nucleotide-binding protein DprA/Smf involved in DNA uptake